METPLAGSQSLDKQQDDLRERARTHSPEPVGRKGSEPAETIRERDEQIADQVRQQVEQERQVPTPGEPAGGE